MPAKSMLTNEDRQFFATVSGGIWGALESGLALLIFELINNGGRNIDERIVLAGTSYGCALSTAVSLITAGEHPEMK